MREAFALLGRGTSGGDDPWLQLVGQRGALRGIAPPDLARLEHRLQLSRQRHRELSAEVRGLDRRVGAAQVGSIFHVCARATPIC